MHDHQVKIHIGYRNNLFTVATIKMVEDLSPIMDNSNCHGLVGLYMLDSTVFCECRDGKLVLVLIR